MTGTSPETALEIQADHDTRLAGINGALDEHGLAGRYEHAGIVQYGELAAMGVDSVTRLGDGGYHLVTIPTQFKPNKVDPGTGEVTPGARGTFKLMFQSQELSANSHLIVPIVSDAPAGYESPLDLPPADDQLRAVNEELAAHQLRGFAHPVNASGSRIEGLVDLNTENERFFSVAVVRVRHADGTLTDEPYVINANSIGGIDGSIFPAIVRLSMYAGEARLQLVGNYRPTLGRIESEVSRGFYNKGQGNSELRIPRLTDTSHEGIAAAMRILKGETGMDVPDAGGVIQSRGSVKQDPRFEFARVNHYGVVLDVPGFGPRDLEDSEAMSVRYLSLGEIFSQLPQMLDAFSVTALSRELIARGILDVNEIGKLAGDNNQRLAFAARHQVQYGGFGREVIRGNPNESGYPVETALGRVAVNTGIARITPELFVGNVGWNDLRRTADANGESLRLLTPEQTLRAVQDGSLDVVTSAAAVKVLHGMGYMGVNWANLATAA